MLLQVFYLVDDLRIKKKLISFFIINNICRISRQLMLSLIISDVEDLNGAISIGKPKPINNGPITFALLIDFHHFI